MTQIVDRLDEMAETTSEIKNEIKQLETKEKRLFKETIENCEQSIPILKAIEEKVNNLVTSLEAPLQIQPSVRPKEPAKHASGNRESEQNSKPEAGSAEPDKTKTDKVDQKVEEEIVELRSRKCLFLSSSIGLGCNMEEMENRLDCEIIPIPTYHIEKRVGARDPELNLKENLKLELEKRKNIDLLIIATGSNDITFLDTKNKDVSDLITTACNQSREIVQLANEAAQKYDLDVFVVEKPPRDETTNNDPLSDCSISSNGLFHSLITPLEKVHYVPLPSLQKISEQSRMNLFDDDGIHLKRWGLKLLSEDIISGVKKVYKDITDDGKFFPKDGKKENQKKVYQNKNKWFQSDGENFHDGRRHNFNKVVNQNRQTVQKDGPYRQWDNRRNDRQEGVNVNPQVQNDFHPSGSFHPAGKSEGFDTRRRDDQRGFHPGGRNEHDHDKPHQPHKRENFRHDFHPAGRNNNPHEDFHPGGHRRNGFNPNLKDNYRARNNERGTGHPNRGQANRGHATRGGHEQSDGMADVVNMLKTLMGNGRY